MIAKLTVGYYGSAEVGRAEEVNSAMGSYRVLTGCGEKR